MRCSCGAIEPEGARFCQGCGRQLDRGDGDRVPYAPVRPAPRRWLAGSLVALILTGMLSATVALAVSGGSGSVIVGRALQSNERPTTTTTEVPGPEEYTDQELAARFGDAVHRVEVDGCGFEGTGSAFAIDEHHLVTNWHVVAVDATPVVRARDGTIREGRVIGAMPNPDVAVIEVAETLERALEWADTDALAEGQHLVGLGYPVPATDFTVSPGTILSFQTGPFGRAAIRTDASLDRGNSGGPALTSTGQVAGVITEMALNHDGFQNVPLLFTHAALKHPIQRMLDEPVDESPDCDDLDLMPEFPEDYFEWPEPDPSWADGVYVPPPYEPPPPPPTVPCPTGDVTVEVSSVEASDPYGLGMWEVTVRGTIHNRTSAVIGMASADVMVPGDFGPSMALADQFSIPPGGSSTWSTTTMILDGPRPTSAEATVSMFMWEDVEVMRCPTA
jgi:hypothetical protein